MATGASQRLEAAQRGALEESHVWIDRKVRKEVRISWDLDLLALGRVRYANTCEHQFAGLCSFIYFWIFSKILSESSTVKIKVKSRSMVEMEWQRRGHPLWEQRW